MNGAFCSLFDGQSPEVKPTSRFGSSNQSGVRSRVTFSDAAKVPFRKATNRRRNRRSFPVRSSFEDCYGISRQAQQVEFREELVDFAKNAQTMPDPKSLYEAVAPEARSAMKTIITRMLGSISHLFFDIRYSSITEQCKTLVLSILITGYMVKNAQDRMDMTRTLMDSHSGFEAATHGVEGHVVISREDGSPKHMPAADYIAQLEAKVKEMEQRERDRYDRGESDPIVDYMISKGYKHMDELAIGASEDVLLAMHICTEELVGKGDPNAGPMTCSLPQKEMFRLLEWLMIFGYNLRCKEIKHEMEMALQSDASPEMHCY